MTPNLMKTDTDALDLETLIRDLMAQHQTIIMDALDKHHDRELLVYDDCDYTTAGDAIPSSVAQYTQTFLAGIRDIVAANKGAL